MILALVIGPLLRHKYFLWTWKLFTIYWPCCCVCPDIAKHNRTNMQEIMTANHLKPVRTALKRIVNRLFFLISTWCTRNRFFNFVFSSNGTRRQAATEIYLQGTRRLIEHRSIFLQLGHVGLARWTTSSCVCHLFLRKSFYFYRDLAPLSLC